MHSDTRERQASTLLDDLRAARELARTTGHHALERRLAKAHTTLAALLQENHELRGRNLELQGEVALRDELLAADESDLEDELFYPGRPRGPRLLS